MASTSSHYSWHFHWQPSSVTRPPRSRKGRASTSTYSIITSRFKAAIFGESILKSTEIKVETFNGTVQLSSLVSSEAATNKAIEVARAVKGVQSVKNDMRIK